MSSVYLHIHSNDVADGASECGAVPPHPRAPQHWDWAKKSEKKVKVLQAATWHSTLATATAVLPQDTVAVVGNPGLCEVNKRIDA